MNIDCDVLEADGGTRTLSITGGFIALVDSLHAVSKDLPPGARPLRDSIAAVSVGIVDGKGSAFTSLPDPWLDVPNSQGSCAPPERTLPMMWKVRVMRKAKNRRRRTLQESGGG